MLEDAIKTLSSSPSAPKDASSILTAISCDVSSQDSLSAAVAQIKQETGYVDVLFNNAGLLGPANGKDIYAATSIEELSTAMLKDFDQWTPTMAINTQAIIGVSAQFLPLLEAANTRRGWKAGKVTGAGNPRQQDKSALSSLGLDPDDDRLAHIITVASVASFMRYCTAGLAYNASKSGAAHLSKMMSTFLAEWGVRSNLVCPGPYPSEMTAGIDSRYGTGQIPQGRMGGLNDFGALVLFLVGKGGAYINGSVQVTDGGRIAVWPATY